MITKHIRTYVASCLVLLGVCVLAPSTITHAAAPVAGSTYVALGDSFSSGNGSGIVPGQPIENQFVYDPATNTSTNQCLRSSIAYPANISRTYRLSLKNVSCGGADTTTVMSTGQFGEAAQINAVTSDTKLVTLTIGGNDIGFVNMVSCIVSSECTATSPSVVATTTALTTLPGKLDTVLSTIKSKAPSAHVLIGGYPQIVSAPGLPAFGCQPWLSVGEQTIATNIETQVNSVISAAATRNGVTYVDPTAAGSPFLTRDILGQPTDACSLGALRQINGIRVDFNAGSFHPNAYGQNSYTKLFSAAL